MHIITILEIKNNIKSHQGEKVKITINGSRNRTEEYEAIIKSFYGFIFVVEKDDDKSVKTFTYSDILTESVCIDFI